MIRWIVNPSSRAVRNAGDPYQRRCYENTRTDPEYLRYEPQPGEFFYDAPTAADAMMAGKRHLIANEAAQTLLCHWYVRVIGDRIEPAHADTNAAADYAGRLMQTLEAAGYDVWREGVAIVVLRGPK